MAQKEAQPPEQDDRPPSVKAKAFLKAYRMTGSVQSAAKMAGISRRLHYFWMGQYDDKTGNWIGGNANYRKRFNRARQIAGDFIEGLMMERARDGHLRPVFYQGQPILDKNGKPIGIREYPDWLLPKLHEIFLPERHKRKFEHTGKDGGPIKVQNLELDDLSDEELASLVKLLKKAQGVKK